MHPYLFVLFYFGLCVLYMKRMRYSPELPNRIVFKVLPLGILIGATMEYMKNRHVLSIKNSSFAPRIYTMVGGFLFHAMSNVYYEFPNLRYYGIVCYALALIVEIYGYSRSFDSFGDFNQQELVVIAILAIVSIAVYIYVLPKLNVVNAVLVFIFSALDSIFLLVLTSYAIHASYGPHYLGVVGAALRYIADVLQVISVWRIPFSNSFEIIMTINYIAQLAIAGSVLLPITL